ncbi:hypothetical protein BX264_4319 [Streptomyces sp. 2333.5]|uniref:hypothetical protein n=1 Tax=unclassified Streptomyces TaxID=2593676 RepID=UPI0008945A3E|nr:MULTISPECIES: hypothetical protein [unclassified Streptomyces]PJJ03918.1 hypothetical protein BX264_4319 [Streptomyces sp. 2333.5]SEE62751.1 hypothetical protein SAMN05428942_4420 [Streptomyces sp. 2112.2]SOE11703.1 hypothetical protein SAMN06272775_2687 [Streptomyces sp. 2323.1]
MTDRRRRAALLLSLPATAPGTVLLPRERKPSSASPDPGTPDSAGSDRDNPFAPPPADAPDQEWRPRHPAGPDGQDGQDGQDEDGAPSKDDAAPSWGNQWSPRQPGRQNGGFGTRPGGRGGPQSGGPGGSGGGLRWDPTDPAQRRARYALLAGMWAFFCVLFSLPEVALLLAALALYWGVSALRAKPDSSKATAAATTAAMEGRPAPATEPAPGGQPGATSSQGSTRPQVTAAIAGLVTASLALMMVAATFTVQIVYRDYFTCVNDALTQSSGKSCEKLLPKELRPLLSNRE